MISIRPMITEDIQPSRQLLSELGYLLERKELRRRYDSVMGTTDHAVLVTEDEGHIIALYYVYKRPALDKPPEARLCRLLSWTELTVAGEWVGTS
jgi:hypothetical protein